MFILSFSLVDNNLNRRNEILRDKITGFHGSSDTINSPKLDITPYDDFNIKSNITYSKFLKNKCTDKIKVNNLSVIENFSQRCVTDFNTF